VAAPLDDVVARVDARTGRITDRITVGRTPVGLALVDDRLWVADYLDETVSVVDTRRREVVQTVHLDGRPVELAAGPSGIWAAVEKPR
jgi:YVTN family beta-propeller protein